MEENFSKEEVEELDKEGVLLQIMSLDKQCAEAKSFLEGRDIKVDKPNCLVICGMGGSGICADIVAAYLYKYSFVPFYVVKDYRLPNFVGRDSVVILISYSGDTKETNVCYQEAVKQGAQIFAITSGGRLKEILPEDKIIFIPKGFLPRCAIGYMTISLLTLLSKLLPNFKIKEDIEETIDILTSIKEELAYEKEISSNPAKLIASKIIGKLPVVYGVAELTGAVAQRWKQQINENSKYLCFYNNFPELTHNEIMSFEVLEHPIIFIFLMDKGYSQFTLKAIEFFKTNFSYIPYIEVNSKGSGLLARIFSLIYIGDFVSFYLALLRKQVPAAIASIQKLKEITSNLGV
jgi:glucose/mannose-6-phosphate isomerase